MYCKHCDNVLDYNNGDFDGDNYLYFSCDCGGVTILTTEEVYGQYLEERGHPQ